MVLVLSRELELLKKVIQKGVTQIRKDLKFKVMLSFTKWKTKNSWKMKIIIIKGLRDILLEMLLIMYGMNMMLNMSSWIVLVVSWLLVSGIYY